MLSIFVRPSMYAMASPDDTIACDVRGEGALIGPLDERFGYMGIDGVHRYSALSGGLHRVWHRVIGVVGALRALQCSD